MKIRSAISFLTLSLCLGIFGLSCTSKHQRPQDKVLHQLMSESIENISAKYHLRVIGSGSASMENIQKITLIFESNKKLHEEEAEQLISYCTEMVLNTFNSNAKVKPYLSSYPLTSKNLQISIAFLAEPEGTYVSKEYIASARVYEGDLTLSYFDPKLGHLKVVVNRPYHTNHQL